MKKTLIVALLVLIIPSLSMGQKDSSKSKWQQLFNGRDKVDWEQVGSGSFVVEDGTLKTEGGMGLLWYTGEKFENCVIRVVYKVTSTDSNAGIFIRIGDKPKNAWDAVHGGYEIQIEDNPKSDEFHRTGAVYSFAKTSELASKPSGEWNTMEITLKGTKVLVSLNGKKVTDFDPAQPVPERKFAWEPHLGDRQTLGYIGLQNHDDARKASVYFKEVSVRKL